MGKLPMSTCSGFGALDGNTEQKQKILAKYRYGLKDAAYNITILGTRPSAGIIFCYGACSCLHACCKLSKVDYFFIRAFRDRQIKN
jgi:hypothetical protein